MWTRYDRDGWPVDVPEYYLQRRVLDDPDIKHVNGVAWHDAPLPPRWHRCFVQTSGWIGLSQYMRCACGAVCNSPERDVAPHRWHWMERNQRRQHGETT